MRKILTVVIVVLVVIAGAYFLFINNKNGKETGPTYTRVNPDRGSVMKTVAASGSVTSNLDVEIKCKASGEIITLPYDISASVVMGDLLVELDPMDEERNVSLAQVSLHESQARLSRAQENLAISVNNLATARERAQIDLDVAEAKAADARSSAARTRDLYESGFISEEELEIAETAVVSAEAAVDAANLQFAELDSQEASLNLLRQDVTVAGANVESANINLETAMQRLDDTRVYAPMDGVVTERYVQIGQIISSGISSTSGGTPVMMLSDLSRLFINARVDESDIGAVETGQRVKISVDAFQREEFIGEVVRIAPGGVNVSNVVTFEVRIEVTSGNKSMLMPLMTADVEIVTAEHKDVLRLPSNAINRVEGRTEVLIEGEGGRPVPKAVDVGIDNGEYVEIISGLTEADVVLINSSMESSMWRNQSEARQGPPPGMMPMGRQR